ncbi:MAG: NADH-quinone oxidoreductase subunit A [Dehalococcoidia bacterium]|nr:NADH-quinone oxidoreductase subunit A [Dehalococcoidia bacterium]MCB9484404.1 NADH-quinone oxidoreductase subunit A [Dehalococcoidia bacterium]
MPQADALYVNYVPVLLATITGFMMVFTALIASRLLAPFSKEREKGTTYECGMLPIRRAATNVGMRYYLYAILFIVFDVEAVFIFPWATAFVGIGQFAYWLMVIFVAILAMGLGYAWKKGALQWR